MLADEGRKSTEPQSPNSVSSAPSAHHFPKETTGNNALSGAAYYQTTGKKDFQEDALACGGFTLPSTGLTPTQIAERLWTTYQLLDINDAGFYRCGSTATTTVYDGKGNIITATLADSVSFIAVLNQKGEPIKVTRLNSFLHIPSNRNEQTRIQKAGGKVEKGRARDETATLCLNITRAIGDRAAKKLFCSESKLDITSTATLLCELDPNNIGSILLISASDGFTEPTGKSSDDPSTQEYYLFMALQNIAQSSPSTIDPKEIAKQLANYAQLEHYGSQESKDNISVVVQPITEKTPPCYIGVYDGHAGTRVASYVAEHFAEVFQQQCELTQEAYNQQPLSAHTKRSAYLRDNFPPNPKAFPYVQALLKLTMRYQKSISTTTHAELYKALSGLIMVLKSDLPSLIKIENYFHVLESHLPLIRQDKRKQASTFLKGVALIALTIFTGIIPGLIAMGIMYHLTHRHVGDYFKSRGKRFENEVELFKKKYAFFKTHYADPPSPAQNNLKPP